MGGVTMVCAVRRLAMMMFTRSREDEKVSRREAFDRLSSFRVFASSRESNLFFGAAQ
ncbi:MULTISPECIES: hypothetical protein [Bacteria]|uniref:hypothetical protein n=1 Tax=Bacteria TaxID=2 RepID=UPI001402898C|nr:MULTISPECIES: hypothetical protein [Bacteria]